MCENKSEINKHRTLNCKKIRDSLLFKIIKSCDLSNYIVHCTISIYM